MVKVRVTVTVVPENVYFAAQGAPFNTAFRSAPVRKLPVACESPETWTIGQFVNKIKDAFNKTYKGEDLGTIKYIKDEDDCDLHTDLSVYDAFVDTGREAMDRSDQRSKITIVQEQGLPLRGGSVMPDLSAPKYQYPRPPPPPLFSTVSQAPSNARKRSMDAAFGENGSSAYSLGTPPIHRLRLDTTNVGHNEDIPLKSVEHDIVQDDESQARRQEIVVDLTQDVQMSISGEPACVGHDTADHRILADVEPKSESPDPQVAFQQPKPYSMSSLEIAASATTATHHRSESDSLARSGGQGEGHHKRHDTRTPRQGSRDHTPLLSTGKASDGRRAAALRESSASEVLQPGPAPNILFREQLQMQTLHDRSNALITPPSDASLTNVKGKPSRSTPKSVISSVKATSTSSMFRPTMPRQGALEPQSSIEDSQMSPRSKRRSTSHTGREVSSARNVRHGSRTVPKSGGAMISFSEAAQLYDRSTPIVSGKRPRNEPVYNWSETLSVLGDEEDYQRQSHQVNGHHIPEESSAVQDMLDEEMSIAQSTADSGERNEDLLEVSHKTDSSTDSHKSASLSRERSGSIDHEVNESNKEHSTNAGTRRLEGIQGQEHIADAAMQPVLSGDGNRFSSLGPQRSNELFQDVNMLTERNEPPPGPKSKDQTTIDILNGGGSLERGFYVSGDVGNENKPKGSFQTPGPHSTEAQDEASNRTKSHSNFGRERRKKKKSKSGVEDGTPRPETAAGLQDFDMDKDELVGNGADSPHAVLDVVRHQLSGTKATSEIDTPTSIGSAGNQLQESLQASTKEAIQSTRTATTSRHKIRPSAILTSQADNRIERNKVYDGIVRANEGVSALIELQGVKGNPCGWLHKNALPEGHFKGLIADKLSLGQVVSVKLSARSSQPKDPEGFIKLTMIGIDQPLGQGIPPPLDDSLLDKPQKQKSGVREVTGHLMREQSSPSNPRISQLAASSPSRTNLSQVGKATSNNPSADTVIERREPELKELKSADRDDDSDTEVAIIHTGVRPSTPKNDGHQEPRFGLGFTNTPRKRKEGTATGEETSSTNVASSTQSTPSHKRPSAGNEKEAVEDGHRSEYDKANGVTGSNAQATRNVPPQPKKASKKTKVKSSLPEKTTTTQPSAEKVRPQARQGVNLEQTDTKVSGSITNSDRREQASLPTKDLQTDSVHVEPQENLSIPKTMTKEQYLAQRKANAAAIARRNAVAAQKDGIITLSGTAKVHPGMNTARSMAKKQKDKQVGERSVSTTLETPPPAGQTIHGTSSDKRRSVEQSTHNNGLQLATSDHKNTKNDSGVVTGQKEEDGRKAASIEGSTMNSQATSSSTPSQSVPRAPAQAANAVPPTVPTNSALKTKARLTKPKPREVKPLITNLIQAKPPVPTKALSLAELRAQKEAVKKSKKASSTSLSLFKSTATTNRPRNMTFGSDSDESSGSESESESSSDDVKKQGSAAAGVKRKAFQRVASKPDPTIRDRSMSIDLDESE